MIIVDDRILIEVESYSHYYIRMVFDMVAMFILAAIVGCSILMKYVLQNVSKQS
ncbi:hypothetical protein [Bacillus sp. 03113]|uniref:hypothetical protein n=1 Tax=Bacillus sp. 03113 TaxID=2578211 RepID=UPI0015E89BD2|nr:hypothetical protein [Bacillus sp. 03113]